MQQGTPSSSNWGYSYIWGMNIYRLRLRIIIFCSKFAHNYHHFPATARSLYKLSRKLLIADERSRIENHLDTLSVQSKLKDSARLETCCGTWNRLMLGCHPGQFLFILRAASDTLPTAVNLQRCMAYSM